MSAPRSSRMESSTSRRKGVREAVVSLVVPRTVVLGAATGFTSGEPAWFETAVSGGFAGLAHVADYAAEAVTGVKDRPLRRPDIPPWPNLLDDADCERGPVGVRRRNAAGRHHVGRVGDGDARDGRAVCPVRRGGRAGRSGRGIVHRDHGHRPERGGLYVVLVVRAGAGGPLPHVAGIVGRSEQRGLPRGRGLSARGSNSQAPRTSSSGASPPAASICRAARTACGWRRSRTARCS